MIPSMPAWAACVAVSAWCTRSRAASSRPYALLTRPGVIPAPLPG